MSPIVAGGLLIYFCDYKEIIINGYSATKKTHKSNVIKLRILT